MIATKLVVQIDRGTIALPLTSTPIALFATPALRAIGFWGGEIAFEGGGDRYPLDVQDALLQLKDAQGFIRSAVEAALREQGLMGNDDTAA